MLVVSGWWVLWVIFSFCSLTRSIFFSESCVAYRIRKKVLMIKRSMVLERSCLIFLLLPGKGWVCLGKSVVLMVLWPKKGTLCPIYLIETMSAISMPRIATPAMVPRMPWGSAEMLKGKRRVGTASPKQTAPPTPLLHRYGNSQWFLAKNTMGLWSVTPSSKGQDEWVAHFL